jgi:hypothetical protein
MRRIPWQERVWQAGGGGGLEEKQSKENVRMNRISACLDGFLHQLLSRNYRLDHTGFESLAGGQG